MREQCEKSNLGRSEQTEKSVTKLRGMQQQVFAGNMREHHTLGRAISTDRSTDAISSVDRRVCGVPSRLTSRAGVRASPNMSKDATRKVTMRCHSVRSTDTPAGALVDVALVGGNREVGDPLPLVRWWVSGVAPEVHTICLPRGSTRMV